MKLKHCYEQSKCKNEYQHGWKGKEKGKGKWQPKRTRPSHAYEKENVDHKRYLMQLDKDMGHISRNNIEVRVLVSWSVGHVARNTLREIVNKIRVVSLRYTVHRRHRLLGMLVRVFHVFVQQ